MLKLLVFDVSVARGSGEQFASSTLSGRVRPNVSFQMQISPSQFRQAYP
jgi:hypothetical protein